uniref:Uncharacterized protein n=1 Tax=Cucumis melo TaxID=3656 RepID=A0A9I9E448_CUCME
QTPSVEEAAGHHDRVASSTTNKPQASRKQQGIMIELHRLPR